MLKFIKHNLDTINGVEIYPIISLLIFFTFFVGIFIWVYNMPKKKIEEISNLPLEQDENINKE